VRAAPGTIASVDEREDGPRRQTRKTILFVLAGLWIVIFLLGALGELFDIELLRRITDFKRIFLR